MRAGKKVSELRARFFARLCLWAGVLTSAGVYGQPTGPVVVPDAPAELLPADSLVSHAPTVLAIEVRLDAPLVRPVDFASLLAFAPGDPLTEARVRRTLSNFHATDLFAEVEVWAAAPPARPAQAMAPPARPAPAEGVVAVVVLRSHTWVDQVELVGELGLKKSALLAVVEQQARAPLVEDRMLRSVYALQDLLAAEGYLAAKVALAVTPLQSRRQVHVAFHIESGPRAVIGAVHFAGDLGHSDPQALLATVRAQPGTPYDPARIRGDLERLRADFLAHGYLGARVAKPDQLFDPETATLDLTYQITAGPQIELQVVGADQRKLAKAGLFSYLEAQTYDAALLVQTQERVRAHLQEQGHYRAQVSAQAKSSADRIAVTFTVDPGPILHLTAIDVVGQDVFPKTELLRLLKTSTRQPLKRGSGHLIDRDLVADLANLHSFFVLQGFSVAQVMPARVEQVGTSLRLEIPVELGPRQRVVNLDCQGIAHFTCDELLRDLPLQPGGPFHQALLTDSINTLRTRYEEAGYNTVDVASELDWNPAKTLVDVRFVISEGQRQVLDRILLRGLSITHSDVLTRFIALRPGDPLSRRRLLELERDLYRLGIFSHVDVELMPVREDGERRDVLVRLEEGRRLRLAYGFSYHSDDGIGGLLSAARNNVSGRADRLQFDLRGDANNARFRLIYDQPGIRLGNTPVTYSLFRQRDERESFTVDDLGAQISLTRDFRRFRFRLGYNYRRVDLSAESIDPSEIERQDRELEISSLTPHIFIDRRNDPVEPSRGFSTTVEFEYAFPLLRAKTDFVKAFWQQTQYFDLGASGVFALSLRAGAIEPLDPNAEPDVLVPEGLPSRLVPASERFFAGGRTTHRAFRRDELGILGKTLIDVSGRRIEAGGNGLFLLNLDYRFPLVGSLGGTAFADLGNVWADWRDFAPADLRLGVGLGLRYRSPIGPLRLDVGWKVDREPGERDFAFFFSFGNPF